LPTGRDNSSAEITTPTLYSSKRNCEMNGHYAMDKRDLPKNGSVEVRIQMLKRPSISGSLS
jgi:hypothetical protein